MAKPRRVQEPTSPYTPAHPKSAAQPGIRTVNLEEVRKNNGKLVKVHRDVLKKLAQ
jgi:hypothetical protein